MIPKLRNMKFLTFYIFPSPYNQRVMIFDFIVFPLAAFVLFRDWVAKMHD